MYSKSEAATLYAWTDERSEGGEGSFSLRILLTGQCNRRLRATTWEHMTKEADRVISIVFMPAG